MTEIKDEPTAMRDYDRVLMDLAEQQVARELLRRAQVDDQMVDVQAEGRQRSHTNWTAAYGQKRWAVIFVMKVKRALFGVLLSAGAAATTAAALVCGLAATGAGIAGALPAWAATLIAIGTPIAVVAIAAAPRASVELMTSPALEASTAMTAAPGSD